MNDFDIESEWASFLEDAGDSGGTFMSGFSKTESTRTTNTFSEKEEEDTLESPPEPSPIYISTKSIITYLNMNIDINSIFWKLPIAPYSTPTECVVKKEIKLTSLNFSDLEDIQSRVQEIKKRDGFVPHIKEHIIISINNPDGRIKFKDVRKLSIGICKKDINTCRSKQKGAFYNCLVIIIRMKMENETAFREMHVKIFNTGKIEVPGIQTDQMFEAVCEKILQFLQPFVEEKLEFLDTPPETVLINSNFNCHFFINRQKLFDILRIKYKVLCLYDSSYYPGIQCKFVDVERNIKNVSFMIFRTGSILIVGKCNEVDIHIIYNYVKKILTDEYTHIYQRNYQPTQPIAIVKKKKTIRRKKILVTETNPSVEEQIEAASAYSLKETSTSSLKKITEIKNTEDDDGDDDEDIEDYAELDFIPEPDL